MTDEYLYNFIAPLIHRIEDLEAIVQKLNNTRLRHDEEITALKVSRHCPYTKAQDQTGMYDGMYKKDEEK